jgi:hypothetical protein
MNKVSMSLKDREAKTRKTSETFEAKGKITKPMMSTHASVLVDSVGPPSAEVCRAASSFP